MFLFVISMGVLKVALEILLTSKSTYNKDNEEYNEIDSIWNLPALGACDFWLR